MTATEWLIDEWMHLDAEFDMVLIDKNTYWEKLKEKHKQAKEMEKQDIISGYAFGHNDGCRYMTNEKQEFEHGEGYYQETFKSE